MLHIYNHKYSNTYPSIILQFYSFIVTPYLQQHSHLKYIQWKF